MRSTARGSPSKGPGKWIYVSGQVALGEDMKLVPGDLASQTELTLDHVERVLRRAGGELSHVVRMNSYLTSLDDYA